MQAVEGQLEAIEITVEGVNAESVAMRQNLQEILRRWDGRERNQGGQQSDGSHHSTKIGGGRRTKLEEEMGDKRRSNSIGGREWNYRCSKEQTP